MPSRQDQECPTTLDGLNYSPHNRAFRNAWKTHASYVWRSLMAEKKLWIGSIGPLLYDDEDVITDENGNPIDTQHALFTEGAIKANITSSNISDPDLLELSYTPTNYTPDTSGTEATSTSQLAAHLKGIDDKLGEILSHI